MSLNIDIEVHGYDKTDINVTQQSETISLEVNDGLHPSILINDDAGLGDTNVTWSADKSSRELADKVDKVDDKGLSTEDYTTSDKDK